MAPRVFEVSRPEGGSELFLAMYARHRCPEAIQAEMMGNDDEDYDLLQFPYGAIGFGIPNDTPYEVISTLPCEACLRSVKAMFVWRGPKHIFLAS